MASVLSTQSATITAGTSISVAGLNQTAGTDRVVYVKISFESANAPETVSAPQWAGVAMETVTDGTTVARGTAGSGFSAWVQWFQIRSASLPADAGTKTFTCTLSGSPAEGRLSVVIVEDAAQDRNVSDVGNYGVAGSGNPNWTVTAPDAASVVIGAAVCGNSGTWTPSGGFTERDDSNLASSGHHTMTDEPGSSGDVTGTHSFSGTVNRAAASGFVVADGVVPPTETDGALQQASSALAGTLALIPQVDGALQQAALSIASSLTVTAPTQVDGALQQAASNLSGEALNGTIVVTGALTIAATLVATQLDGGDGQAGIPNGTGGPGSLPQLELQSLPRLNVTQVALGDTGGTFNHDRLAGDNTQLHVFCTVKDAAVIDGVTYAGQPLALLRVEESPGPPVQGAYLFVLLHSDMPVPGAADVVVSVTNTGGREVNCIAVTFADATQQLPADSGSNGQLASQSVPTFPITGLAMAAGSRFAQYFGGTINGADLVPPFFMRSQSHPALTTSKLGLVTGGGHIGGGYLSQPVPSADSYDFEIAKFIVQASRFATVGAILLPAPDTVTDGALSQPVATLVGSLEVESQLSGALQQAAHSLSGAVNKLRSLDASLGSAAATVSGSAQVQLAVSGALVQEGATVVGAASVATNVSATLQVATSVLTGTANKLRELSGAFSSQAALLSGELEVATNAAGALQQAGPILSGALNKLRDIDAALDSGAASVLGLLSVGDGVDGVFAQPGAELAGSLEVESQLSGALQQGASTVASEFNRLRELLAALDQSAGQVSGSLEIATRVFADLEQVATQVAGSLQVAPNVNGSLQQPATVLSASLLVATRVVGALTQQSGGVAGTVGVALNVEADLIQPTALLSGALNRHREVSGALQVAATTLAGTVLGVVFTGSLHLVLKGRPGSTVRLARGAGSRLRLDARSGATLRLRRRIIQ